MRASDLHAECCAVLRSAVCVNPRGRELLRLRLLLPHICSTLLLCVLYCTVLCSADYYKEYVPYCTVLYCTACENYRHKSTAQHTTVQCSAVQSPRAMRETQQSQLT